MPVQESMSIWMKYPRGWNLEVAKWRLIWKAQEEFLNKGYTMV